jgi:hypothetical protein
LAIDFSREDLLKELVAVVRADPAELTQIRHVSCDECWPIEADEGGKPRPPGLWTEPNPECQHCQGDGIPRAWFADTRKLSPTAAKLFTAAQQTKDGLKVIGRDKDAALEKLAKILGAYEKDNAQKTKPMADALRELFAGVHQFAGGLPIAPAQPQPAPTKTNPLAPD